MPVMNKFEHGTLLACFSSLIGILEYKNKKIEDCQIVIAKRENYGEYQIDHEEYSSQLVNMLESLDAKIIYVMEEIDIS